MFDQFKIHQKASILNKQQSQSNELNNDIDHILQKARGFLQQHQLNELNDLLDHIKIPQKASTLQQQSQQNELNNQFIRSQLKSFKKDMDQIDLKEQYQNIDVHIVRYLARKLPDVCLKILPEIMESLQQEEVEDQLIIRAQSFKYICKNSKLLLLIKNNQQKADLLNDNSVTLSRLTLIVKNIQNSKIKSEICLGIIHLIQKNDYQNTLLQSERQELESLYHEDINQEVMRNLQNILKHQTINQQLLKAVDFKAKNYNTSILNKSQQRKSAKVEVTRSQIKQKNQIKNHQSEKKALSVINLQKSLQRQKKQNAQNEKLIEAPIQQGSDVVWYNDTYGDVLKLYNLVKAGQQIKEEDKNGYLHKRFLDSKYTMGSLFGLFNDSPRYLFMDIMISEIYMEISKKGQILNKETLDKIIKCLNSKQNVRQLIFNMSNQEIAKRLACKQIIRDQYQTQPQRIREIGAKFKSKCYNIQLGYFSDSFNYDENGIIEVLDECIDLIRFWSLKTIESALKYDNSLSNSRNLSQILSKLMEDSNPQIRKQATLIIVSQVNDSSNYSTVFKILLADLEKESCSQLLEDRQLAYINKQINNLQRCKELFTLSVLEKFVLIAKNNKTIQKIKLFCLDILSNYVLNTYQDPSLPLLSEGILSKLIDVIKEKNCQNDIKQAALLIILFQSQRSKSLPSGIINQLVDIIGSLDETNSNYLIISFAEIRANIDVQQIKCIQNKLKNHTIPLESEQEQQGNIKFVNRNEDNLKYPSIATMTAQIIVDSLSKYDYYNFSSQDSLIEVMIEQLEERIDKQTRILCANSLYLLSQKFKWEFRDKHLITLRDHISDQVLDIQVYITVLFVQQLDRQTEISEANLDHLVQIYCVTDLILEDQCYTITINSLIFSILNKLASSRQFSEDIFNVIIDHALTFNQFVQETYRLLQKYTNPNRQCINSQGITIPQSTILLLESSKEDEAFQILVNVIKNKQEVGEKTIKKFTDDLYKCESEYQRKNSFDILEQIDRNQDISESIFIILEIERAAIYISQNLSDCQDAFQYLLNTTHQGIKLSLSSLQSIYQISNLDNFQGHSHDQVLSILKVITQNGQSLPNYFVKHICDFRAFNKLSELQLDKTFHIINNLFLNNQYIPQKEIDEIENYISNNSNSFEKSSFFIGFLLIRAEKGEKLSQSSVLYIVNEFFNTTQVSLKERITKCLKNIVDQHSCDQICEKINDVLIYCFDKGDKQMQLNAFQALQKFNSLKFNQELINTLVNFIQSQNCTNEYAQKLSDFMENNLKWRLDENAFQHATIRLLKDDLQFLSHIEQQLRESSYSFDKPVFARFQSILQNNQNLTENIFQILPEIIEKQEIPEPFIDFICSYILQNPHNSNEIQSQCASFLQDYLSSGGIISQKSAQKLTKLWRNRDIETLILKIIQKQGISLDLDFTKISNGTIQLIQQIKFKLVSQDDTNAAYLESIARNADQRLDSRTIDKLLICIQSIESLDKFEEIIDFLVQNKLEEDDIISCSPTSLEQLFKGLKIRALNNTLEYGYDRFLFNCLVDDLMESEWQFTQLKNMLKFTESENQKECKIKHDNLVEVLKSISYYKIPSSEYDQIYDILSDENYSQWIQKVHQIAIPYKFQEVVMIKDLEKTISDFKEMNNSNQNSEQLAESASMIIQEIKQNYRYKEIISTWQEEHIKEWSNKRKNKYNQLDNSYSQKIETLVIIRQAIQLEFNYYLTDAQLLSCIITIDDFCTQNFSGKKGTILQVATGEGKSTIVCAIAIYFALQGKNVDVITSSPILAERDVNKTENLYKMFSLNVSDNSDSKQYIKGAKDCYRSDVVYGEISQFQFDILRDEYSQLGTLAGRKTDIAIADEVDSMLIDDSSKIARLSSAVGGMDLIQPLYFYIWLQLNTIFQRIVDINGEKFLLYGKINFEENGLISLEYIDESDNESYQISDLKQYLIEGGEIEKIGIVLQGDAEDFIRERLTNFTQDIIGKKQVNFPKCFTEFITLQIPKWIESALTALIYQENVNYIIDKGVIKPVDFDSTGIVQSSTSWSDGLHQFLQIKHGLKLTSETFTTNFLSNVGYIKKYNKLIGLTGTLGSKFAKKIISEVYKVNLVYIPTKCQKQYFEFEPIICSNQQSWLTQICDSAIKEASTDYKCRGVLIICETISAAEIILDKLKKIYLPNFIKSYTINDNDQEKEVEIIKSGEIIVATNLAGRGTDINTEEIQEFGGMHVIVTFIPQNQRVEDQAFGRTARQGKSGTGQLIVNYEDLQAHYNDQNIQNAINKVEELQTEGKYFNIKSCSEMNIANPKQIKQIRDIFEYIKLNQFQNNDLQNIEMKDQLFSQFCELIKNYRSEIRKKEPLWQRFKASVSDTFSNAGQSFQKLLNINPSALEINTLAGIEDRWAILLKKIDSNVINHKQAFSEFDRFKTQICNEFQQKYVIQNPFYIINIANDYLVRSSDKEENNQANTYADQAISMDKDFVAAAYVAKAWFLLKTKGDQKELEEGYKEKAIKQLKMALSIVSNEMSTLVSIKVLMASKLNIEEDSDLQKQLEQKMNIIGTYIKSLEISIQSIIKSQKVISVYGKKIQSYHHFGNFSSDKEQKLLEVQTNKHTDVKYFVTTFSDLTCQNQGDQAIQVLNSINFKKTMFGQKETSNIQLGLKNVSHESLIQLFNPDISLKQISYSLAKEILNDKKKIPQQKLLERSFDLNRCTVNIEIFKNEISIEKKNSIATQKALTFIEQYKQEKNELSQTTNNFTFNITFNGINEINKQLTKQKFRLDIELPNTSLEQLLEVAEKSQREGKIGGKMYLKIEGLQSDLVEILTQISLNKGIKFYYSTPQDYFNYETIQFDKAVNKLKNTSKNHYQALGIIVEKINLSQFLKISEKCKSLKVTSARFIDVKFNFDFNIFEGLEVKPIFSLMTKSTAIEVIPLLRTLDIRFQLILKKFGQDILVELFKTMKIKRQDMEVTKVKSLSEQFMDSYKPETELSELAARGIEYLFDIREELLIPWRSILSLSLISIAQLGAGAALIMTGFGAVAGLNLITEGMADIYSAYNAYSTREFNWKDYAAQKAISLSISVATLGFGNLKDAAKGIQNGFIGLTKDKLKKAGAQVLKIACKEGGEITTKSAFQTVQKTRSKLGALAIKQISVSSGQTIARVGLNGIVHTMTNFSMESIKHQIQQHIEGIVQEKFSSPQIYGIMRKMITIDTINNSKDLKTKINTIVSNTFNSETSITRYIAQQIVYPLLKGILSDPQYIGGSLSMGLRIVSTLYGMKQIYQVTDEVFKDIFQKLQAYDKNQLHPVQILQLQIKEIKVEEANQLLMNYPPIHENQNNQKIFMNYFQKQQDYYNNRFSNWNSKQFDKKINSDLKQKVENVINKFDKSYNNLQLFHFSEIMKTIADLLTNMIIKTTESNLIQPWSTYAVGAVVDKCSKIIEHNFIVNESEKTESQLKDEQRYKELKSKDYQNLTVEEQKFLQTYDPHNTVTKQINYNAKDYIIAYSQCESKHYASQYQKDKNHQASQDQLNEAQEVQDGAPADIKDKAIMDKQLGIERTEVQITNEQYKDKKFMIQFKNKFKGKSIVINISKSAKNQSFTGHDVLLQSDGSIYDPSNSPEVTKNDCSYAVALKKAGKKVTKQNLQELRSEVAEEIKTNPSVQYAINVMKDIQSRYPGEAAQILREAADDFRTKKQSEQHAKKHVDIQKEFPEIIEQVDKEENEAKEQNKSFDREQRICQIYDEKAKYISENCPSGFKATYLKMKTNDEKQKIIYNEKTNTLVISKYENSEWIIKTMFRPTKGKEYVDQQISKGEVVSSEQELIK